jgi:hypothetical protein
VNPDTELPDRTACPASATRPIDAYKNLSSRLPNHSQGNFPFLPPPPEKQSREEEGQEGEEEERLKEEEEEEELHRELAATRRSVTARTRRPRRT